MMLFAVSSVLCAQWGGKLAFERFKSFCFLLPLMRARRAGLIESAGVEGK